MNARTRKLLAKVAIVFAVGGIAQLASGCSGCQDDEVNPELLAQISDDKGIKIGMKLDQAEREEAARLLASVSNARFPDRMVRRDSNAKLFVYLAAKSEKPDVIRAALRAMSKTHKAGRGGKGGRRAVDADYATVVATHLGSKDDKIVSAALSAAAHALNTGQPDARVLDAVLQIARSHAVDGGRIAAVNVIIKIPHYRRNPRIVAALLQILKDKSPAVLSHTLYQLYQSGVRELQQKPAFVNAGLQLVKHPDPAVRGRAVRMLGVLARGNAEVRDKIRAMLDDKHPYARSIAADALAAFRDVAAIHLLVPKLKDMARNDHHIPYTTLTGKKSAVAHGARNATVHDTCAAAIEKLSAKLPKPWKRPSRKHEKSGREQNLASANAWYAKNKGEIPPLDAPPSAPTAATGKEKAGAKDAKQEAQGAKTAVASTKGQAAPAGKPAPAPAASSR